MLRLPRPSLGRFRFHDVSPLIDRELELVEPGERWVQSYLDGSATDYEHQLSSALRTRQQVREFLRAAPRGRERPDPVRGRVAGYYFWMRLHPMPYTTPNGVIRLAEPPVEIGGSISLRVGDNDDLRLWCGHIGYGVFPSARGHHYAERSVRLLLPLARLHGMRELWITTNPDNWASRRTCERLGAEFVEEVDVPAGHPLAMRGETRKSRYRLEL